MLRDVMKFKKMKTWHTSFVIGGSLSGFSVLMMSLGIFAYAKASQMEVGYSDVLMYIEKYQNNDMQKKESVKAVKPLLDLLKRSTNENIEMSRLQKSAAKVFFSLGVFLLIMGITLVHMGIKIKKQFHNQAIQSTSGNAQGAPTEAAEG